MSHILKRVNDVDANDSDAVKEAVTAYFHNLLKQPETDCNKWLQALKNIINRFPKYCTTHRTTIETFLSPFINSDNFYIVIKAAKCAHALQQVRTSQEKGATAKVGWSNQMNALCNAAHKLLTDLFPNAVDIHKKEKKQSITSTSPLSKALTDITDASGKNLEGMDRNTLLEIRLRNIFVFIQAMLVEIYPVAKAVRPQLILDVIVRALSVSSGKTKRNCDVATVKIQALRTLDALVACLGSNLIPFSPLVFRFVMQTLRWTSENVRDDSSKVRCAAYNSLSGWLNVLQTHHPSLDRRARGWDEEIANHVLDDIIPRKHIVQLTMNPQPIKQLSKKARKQLAKRQLQESSIATRMHNDKNKAITSEESNDEVAVTALECAETFLTVCGVFLKPAIHKLFHERIIRECYNIDAYSCERGIWLLRVLDSCRKSAPTGVPPPTQYCLELYGQLINSQNKEISRFCSQALLDIRLHLHCSPPSLNFALEVRQEKKKGEKRKISEKNRAVLESLLGADKLPPNEDEIITVSDEPCSKKSRLEEAERITVSSESEDSIEISDDDSETVEEVTADIMQEEELRTSQEKELTIQEVEDAKLKTADVIQEEELTIKEVEDAKVEEQIDPEPVFVQETEGDVTELEAEEEPVLEQEITNEQTKKVVETIERRIEHIEENIVEPEKLTETGIHDVTTQLEKYEIDVIENKLNIFEAVTQLPLNNSQQNASDTQESPESEKVSYDYPNSTKRDVTLTVDKLNEENLPSTNDTDDIQITCGQDVKSSQEDEKNKVDLETEEVKVNGVDKSPEKALENGNISAEVTDTVNVKTVNNDISVDDMLADFVDEIVEDKATEA